MRTANANLDILLIAGFGPIVRDTAKSRNRYGEVMRIPLEKEAGDYLHTEALDGVKTFALRPLSQAAQSCFGKDSWPDDVPVPFDVRSVEQATTELESKGSDWVRPRPGRHAIPPFRAFRRCTPRHERHSLPRLSSSG